MHKRWMVEQEQQEPHRREPQQTVPRAPSRTNMLESTGNKLDWLSFAQTHGATSNKKGGYYRRGKQYGMEKKLAVAETYLHYKQLGGGRLSLSKIASEHKVDWWVEQKIESELYANKGCVVSPEEVTLDMVTRRRLGPGSIVLDQADCFALYCLFHRKPTPSLRSYVQKVYHHRGTRVSTSVVSRFLNHTFEIHRGLCVPNLVPYNKFRPRNIEKAVEYIKALARIDPSRLKYADKKSLKGKDICNKLLRWDPFTGIVPPTMTDPDLRNTYSIIGICGISRRSTPLRYCITESMVDAELFALEVEDAIASRFLRAGNVLVMDNAANHTGKENTVLEDWLWEEHSIFALFLPAQMPEWNPIELMWNCLMQRLKHYDWDHLSASYRVVHTAIYVLDCITHDEVERFYEKSGVFTLHGHA